MPSQAGLALARSRQIPAMTNDAERECYYRLARAAADKGAIIEFGAWLGASTAYLAAAMLDSKVGGKVHTFDKFLSKQGHIHKVKEHYQKRGLDLSKAPIGDAFSAFKTYLGSELLAFVEPHRGEIANAKWNDEHIALIVNDAPKRTTTISAMLTHFRSGINEGTVTAWQDFCHFPSYEIPAALYRLRNHFEFDENVYPGSTLVFHVKREFDAEDVSLDALALSRWTSEEIRAVWSGWREKVHEQKRAVFSCGAALFMCDIGDHTAAVAELDRIFKADAEAIIKKWRYLHKYRVDFHERYRPLFQYLRDQGALSC